MKPVTSDYKASTIAYKMPYADFPKDCWITFRIHIDWTVYGKEAGNDCKTRYALMCRWTIGKKGKRLVNTL